MYFIYIIYSKKLNRYYTGTTNDVLKRIAEHNDALYADSFTSKGIPWDLCLSFECLSSEKAYALEKFIKRMKSKVFIEKLLKNKDILRDIQDKL